MQEYQDKFFIELGTPCQDYLERKIDFKTFKKLIETCYEHWGNRTTPEFNQEIKELIQEIENDYFGYDEPERSTRIKDNVKFFIEALKEVVPIFAKTDKRRIYWLIDQYLSNKLNGWDFCNQYHECFSLEIDSNTFTPNEYAKFCELSDISGRFSNVEEDLKSHPDVYTSENQLRKKVIETKDFLQSNA